jgi:hypothetical protein
VPQRDLYFTLSSYPGEDAFADVLMPWRERHGGWRREEWVFGDLLQQAYALSRVSDVLLLGFQPPLPPGAEPGWAHELHLDTDWPVITKDQYLEFFGALSMRPIDATAFDPFLHEIVAVEQADDPDAPIEITDVVWPGLLLGQLLFSRSGVRVRAGIHHAVAGVADRSTLHEVFRRGHRDTSDMSLGWGHNSQWKIDFRRDYLTQDAFYSNVDGRADIDEPEEPPSPLTAQERRDLLVRALVTRSVRATRMAGHQVSIVSASRVVSRVFASAHAVQKRHSAARIWSGSCWASSWRKSSLQPQAAPISPVGSSTASTRLSRFSWRRDSRSPCGGSRRSGTPEPSLYGASSLAFKRGVRVRC